MMVITRAQREALKRIYDRCPLYIRISSKQPRISSESFYPEQPRITYRELRKLIQPGYGCIMLPWCGMLLGIEEDGYIHS